MSVFKRFTDIVNANLHNLLEKAEDPEKMLSYVIDEMEEALVDVRVSAAEQLAEKKNRQRQLGEKERQILVWQEKAALALEKNREDLAKAALTAKQQSVKEQETINEEIAEIEKHILMIQSDGQRLQEKLVEAKSRQSLLKLREHTACARLSLQTTQNRYDIETAIEKFERYERKVERIEAEVQAYDLLKPSSLAQELNTLAQNAQIEEELTQLKNRLAS